MDVMVGNLVRLRAFRDDDYEYLANLRNDMRTQAWGQRLPPIASPKSVRDRVEKYTERPNKGIWAIETKDGKLVGQINYEEYKRRMCATIGIITGTEYWGKGFGHEAIELVLRFLFEERGVQVVDLWTTSWNTRMVGLAKKLGFKEGARLRGSSILSGGVHDALFMDLLREEYYESRGFKDGLPSDFKKGTS